MPTPKLLTRDQILTKVIGAKEADARQRIEMDLLNKQYQACNSIRGPGRAKAFTTWNKEYLAMRNLLITAVQEGTYEAPKTKSASAD
jgi:hypothetical protein